VIGVGSSLWAPLGVPSGVKTSFTAFPYSSRLWSAGLGSMRAPATQAARANVLAARLAIERAGLC
jgi:hypothetical protein